MSTDYLVRATAYDGLVRAFAIDATGVVEELKRRHDTIPVVTAAIGRLSTGALLFGAMLKDTDHLVTIRMQGNGPAGTLLATANGTGGVRGLVGNPQPDVEQVRNGKLNVR
ncbi:MAG: Hsp33 family molecular chaperone HslO, partial [Longimicrobiales bacterium]